MIVPGLDNPDKYSQGERFYFEFRGGFGDTLKKMVLCSSKARAERRTRVSRTYLVL